MSKPKTQLNLKANERIKELVLESGLTRERFAETINYTPQHLSRLLSKTNPTPVTIDTASRIAQVYHVRYEWVMGIDDYKTESDRAGKSLAIREDKIAAFISLMQLHRYVLDDVTANMPYKKDEEGSEYRRTTYKLTSPRGASRIMSELDLLSLIRDLDDYLEMRCAFEFRKPIDDVDNKYDWEA